MVIQRDIDDIESFSIEQKKVYLHIESFIDYRVLTYAIPCEEPVLSRFLQACEDANIVWDIGADVGIYSCLAATTDCDVFSVEPLPDSAKKTRRNLSLNNAQANVAEYAFWDRGTTLELNIPPLSSKRATVRNLNNTKQTVNVKGIRGDDVLDELDWPCPEVLKIDIEGAELKAISGMEETLRHAKYVFIEPHPPEVSPHEIESKLKRHGYSTETVSLDYKRAEDTPYIVGTK